MDRCRSDVAQRFLYEGSSATTSNQHFAREGIFCMMNNILQYKISHMTYAIIELGE